MLPVLAFSAPVCAQKLPTGLADLLHEATTSNPYGRLLRKIDLTMEKKSPPVPGPTDTDIFSRFSRADDF